MVVHAKTVSVRLAPAAEHRVAKAASLLRQSRGAFLERVGDESARHVLIGWAVERYRRGDVTFSELAQETGLDVEEIMAAMGSDERRDALDSFLASCTTVSETLDLPGFLDAAVAAVDALNHPPATRSGAAGEREDHRMRWRVERDRLVLVAATEAQRADATRLLAELRDARPGPRGGSTAVTHKMDDEMTANHLRRATLEQFSKWCHSNGPGYSGRPREVARRLSVALFGRVIPLIDPAGDEDWAGLGSADQRSGADR